MLKKKLAVLGASYLQLPLVEKANSMGIETHCFAWDNEEALCKNVANFFYPISVLEKDLILAKCQEIKIDGITTIATDICVPTIAYVAEKMNLISNSYYSSILSTNKSKMRKAFEENNVNSPKSTTVNSSQFQKINECTFPLIVKPTDRSGSQGVTRVENIVELKKAINKGLESSLEKKVVIEEFIDGKEVSVESISWKGIHYIIAITDKTTSNMPYFVELEHHQPSHLSFEIQNKIKKETLKALNSLKIEYGASHSEFKIDTKGKVFAIEIGARTGGDFIGSHLVELATGYDFIKGVIEIALGEFTKVHKLETNYSGIYFLCKETEYLKPYFYKNNYFDVEKKIIKKELISISNSNDRAGYLIYRSNKKINLS